ncbi:MAG: hypothetical protein JNM93_06005 [Bacteriovoracaceae bacterium]|nr:hypothetical protein [Bacteriovoracaceae bacterium]
MKYKILSLMIITDLLLAPVMVSAQTPCPEGHQYTPSTNTCNLIPGYKPPTSATTTLPGADEIVDCSKIENQGEQTKCYKEDADKKLSESGLESSNPLSGSKLTAISAGISVGLGTLAFVGADTKSCKINSVRFIKIAAVTNAVSELSTLVIYSSKLSSLDRKYREIINTSNTEDETDETKNKEGVNAQDKAYEFVIEQEKTYKTIGTTKGIVYAVTGALYATAAVFSVIEQIENTTEYTKEGTAQLQLTAAEASLSSCILPPACAAASSAVATASANYVQAKASRIKTVNTNTCRAGETEKEIKQAEDEAAKHLDEVNKAAAKRAAEQAGEKVADEATQTVTQEATKEVTKEAGKALGKDIAAQNKDKMVSQTNTGMKLPVISLVAAVGLYFLVDTLLKPEKNNTPAPAPTSTFYKKPFSIDPFDLFFSQKFGMVNHFWSKIIYESVNYVHAMALLGGLEKNIKQLNSLLKNPISRAVVAGSMAAVSGTLSSHSFKEAGKAEKRIKHLQSVRDNEFASTAAPAIAPCTEADRGNSLKPECYCYNPSGDNNTNSESNICKKVWEENKQKNRKKVINKIAETENIKPEFCISEGNTADFSCKCKDTGKCQSIPPNINLGNIGSSYLTNAINDANALMSGRYSGGELAAQKSTQNAMALLKGASKLAKSKGIDKEMAPLKAQVDNMMNNYPPAVLDAYKNANGMGGGASSAGSLASLSPELKKDIEKKLGEEFKSIDVDTSGTSSATSGMDDSIDFGFDDEPVTIEDATAALDTTDAMNAEYEMNVDSDISPAGSDTNIFDIVSLRYKRSGYRRIFGTKDEQQSLDTAEKTDISQ